MDEVIRTARRDYMSASSFFAADAVDDLLAGESEGVAIDFVRATPLMRIKDLTTPANNYNGDPFGKLTFTRSSSATYYNSSGVLSSVASDVGRIDHNPATLVRRGFLTEAQRTNLALRSEAFDNATWNKVQTTITADQSVAPDGTTTGDKWDGNGVNDEHSVYQVISVTNGTPYALSVFAKKNTNNFIQLVNDNVAFTGGYANFDLNNGTIGDVSGVTATMEHVGNGWYRCTIVATAIATTTDAAMVALVSASNAARKEIWTTSNGVYLWGFQMEVSNFATSYIPTTSAQVTRSADFVSLSGTLFPLSATLGTMVDEETPLGLGGDTYTPVLDNGSGFNDSIFIGHFSATVNSWVVQGGSATSTLTAGTSTAGTTEKIATAFAANDHALVRNGGAPSTDTTVTLPPLSRLTIGDLNNGGVFHTNAWLRKFKYLPRRASNSELQTFTT